jgi:hypothetical protein
VDGRVEGDAVGANPGIKNARQFKIGFPTLDDWRWGSRPGTFMFFTTDTVTGCSTSQINQIYARWSGSAWEWPARSGRSVPSSSPHAAATPPALGRARYKFYFGDPSDQTGRIGARRCRS